MRTLRATAVVAFSLFPIALSSPPSCSQTRSNTDPSPSAINDAIFNDGTINKACSLLNTKLDGLTQVDYYALNNAYFFNRTLQTTSGSIDHSCQDSFNTLFNTCVTQQGFWGGSLIDSGVTYSIGAQKYPVNPLLASGTGTLSGGPSSTPGDLKSTSPAPGSATSIVPPQTTSTSISVLPPLITITTSYDPQAASVKSLDPSITGNTAIRTSDDKHPAGLFPVIKGGPKCFFCPPGLDNGGLVLWGMAKPGVYPPPTPPPFPGVTNWPTIEIGNDLQPTGKGENDKPTATAASSIDQTSQPSSRATSSCSISAIVSDCSVICATVGSITPLSASCSTSCFSTASGCGVSGTTITSTAHGSACEQPGPFTSMTTASATSYSWETELYVTLSGSASGSSVSSTTLSASSSSAPPSSAPNSLVPLPVSTDPPGTLGADTNCEGVKASTSSDIFSCFSNATLFQLFAPLGTDVSLNRGTNDKGGWGTWKGAGCYCNQGAFCCDPNAKAPVDANGGSYNEIDINGQGTDIVAYYKMLQTTQSGGCTCDGKKTDIVKRAQELDVSERSIADDSSGRTSRYNTRDIAAQEKHATTRLTRRVDRSAAWKTYASKGQGYWDAFNNRDPNEPDKVLCNFFAAYKLEQASTSPPVASFRPFLTLIGLQIATVYQTVVTWTAPPGKNDAELSNLFDPASGTIVASGNEIGDAPDHWSDIAWYLWRRSCLTADPTTTTFNNLHTIIQRYVTNPDTMNIIADALDPGYVIGEKAYFTPADRDLDKNAFWALLGSPNGNGIIHMLDDNKRMLRGKSIARIGVWANPEKAVMGGGYETHVWAELTP